MLKNVARELELLIRSRYPVVYLLTYEEDRAQRFLNKVAGKLGKKVYEWSSSQGWSDTDLIGEDSLDPLLALGKVLRSSEKALFVFKDFHPYLDSEKHPRVVRMMRDIVSELKSSYKTLILLSPTLKVPDELDKDVNVVDLPLPDAEELERVLNHLLKQVEGNPRMKIDKDPELRDQVVRAALGLTENEASNVFAKAVVHQASFDREDIQLVLEEKQQLIRRSGLLEYIEVADGLDELGGMGELKAWLQARGLAFTEKAREFGLPSPKGVLLLGVQGCGKSVCCKAVASLWKLPLLRMDVGALFNPFIGSSEANMRKAIQTAESLAPVVLWLDEIEKGFAGLKSSGQVDGGVTARVFATFLTWMQEKTAPVFVTATANSIDQLPPEMLRKGRFDEIFFVDLPDQVEREEIFRIHLNRRRRDPSLFDLASLVDASEAYSGAEIEQGVIDGLYNAFPQGRDLQTEDILDSLNQTVPLATTMHEEIATLRDWASTRARQASVQDDKD